MKAEITPGTPIDLGLNPQDPWAVIPADRRERLFQDLKTIARVRREAEVQSRQLPMP